MKAKDLVVTVLAIFGILSILNYVILVAPGIIDLLFYVVLIVVGVTSYNHFANKKKNQNKSEDK